MTFNDKSRSELFNCALNFLERKLEAQCGNILEAAKIIDGYFMSDSSFEKEDIKAYYLRLIGSAQNANMKAGVIGKQIKRGPDTGVHLLNDILSEFDPQKILEKYFSTDIELAKGLNDPKALEERGAAALKQKIFEDFSITSKISESGRPHDVLWTRYCRTLVSAARFMSSFEDGATFRSWVEPPTSFKINKSHNENTALSTSQENIVLMTQLAAPYIISSEVYGIGYALACDFLKESGFLSFGKPDVHIKKILVGVGAVPPYATDTQMQIELYRIAKSVEKTPYAVDKILWLIGSGKFYKTPINGHNTLKIGRNADAFVNFYNRSKGHNSD